MSVRKILKFFRQGSGLLMRAVELIGNKTENQLNTFMTEAVII